MLPASVVRDLEIFIDSDVSVWTHLTRTVSTCFAVLHQLRSIHRSVARSPVAHVVTCFVSTGLRQLDPVGIPAHLLQQLQSVMNAAARLISPSSKFDYVTPVLRQLHWLKVGEQIDFELAVLVYKCLHGLAPPYLIHELCRPADLEARQRLRSASSSSLIVRRTRLSTVGDRAFPVAAARVWNNLPQHITAAPSLHVFASRLKTYFFSVSFPEQFWMYSACEVTSS